MTAPRLTTFALAYRTVAGSTVAGVSHERDLRSACTVSYVAVVWSIAAGAASIVIGLRSASTALVGTGTDVLADMLSSVVLIWRFRAELHGRPASHRAEHRAQLAAAVALLIVAVGIGATAVVRLVERSGATADASGLAIAGISVLVLPVFAVMKYRIAGRVPSPALRLDGHITLVGASMAAVSLLGLLATRQFGWALADPVAAVVIAAIAASIAVAELRRTR
jgi:divalent metal cation (Fe/Co/Zn/Cd) transporter